MNRKKMKEMGRAVLAWGLTLSMAPIMPVGATEYNVNNTNDGQGYSWEQIQRNASAGSNAVQQANWALQNQGVQSKDVTAQLQNTIKELSVKPTNKNDHPITPFGEAAKKAFSMVGDLLSIREDHEVIYTSGFLPQEKVKVYGTIRTFGGKVVSFTGVVKQKLSDNGQFELYSTASIDISDGRKVNVNKNKYVSSVDMTYPDGVTLTQTESSSRSITMVKDAKGKVLLQSDIRYVSGKNGHITVNSTIIQGEDTIRSVTDGNITKTVVYKNGLLSQKVECITDKSGLKTEKIYCYNKKGEVICKTIQSTRGNYTTGVTYEPHRKIVFKRKVYTTDTYAKVYQTCTVYNDDGSIYTEESVSGHVGINISLGLGVKYFLGVNKIGRV